MKNIINVKNVTAKIIRKLYINQFVISIFGVIVTTSASLYLESDGGMIIAALFAAGLYLFIIYDAMWNAGAKDAASRLRAEDAGLEKFKTPFYICLFAGLFNFIGGFIYLILKLIISARELTEGGLALAGDAFHLLMSYANGMYLGFESLLFPHPHAGLNREQIDAAIELLGSPAPMITAPYYYFLVPVPLFITGILAYYVGASETKLLKILGFNK